MSESVFVVFCTLSPHHLPCKYLNKHHFLNKETKLDVYYCVKKN